MQKTVIYYNENEVIEGKGSKEDIKNGYNLWIDLINPTPSELSTLEESFHIDHKAVEKIDKQKTKKAQVMMFNNHKFTVFLSLRFNTIHHLVTNAIYFLSGNGWLITIHPEEVDLLTKGRIMFSEGKRILGSSVDALYYSFLSSMVETYEQILTAIELEVIEVEKKAQHNPSKNVEYLDLLSRQIIILRRHFWHARHIINYHTHMEEDKDDIKYLKIVYDDINQLIELVQSYQDTINSTRETFSSSISLQTNDVMRVLTIFSTIILPLSLLISILSLQGFDLNNLTTIPKYFYFLVVLMFGITFISLCIFWKKRWIFSKDITVGG